MRDAASAAAMSDPTMNRWFRRRWVELPVHTAPSPAVETVSADNDLASTGLALLHEWRLRRAIEAVDS
jgi:hypothetical protein